MRRLSLPFGRPGPLPPDHGPRRIRFRAALHATGLALAGALVAGTLVVTAAPPAAAVPVGTTVVLQSVGDSQGDGTGDDKNVGYAGGTGLQISGTDLLFRATDPKGDQDNQLWYLEASAGGSYKVKSRTKSGCMSRDSDAAGNARLAFRDCGAAGTDWDFESAKGDRYRIQPVGHSDEWLETPLDKGREVTLSRIKVLGNRQEWYVTPYEPTTRAMPADPTFDDMTFMTAHNAFYNSADVGGIGTSLPPNQWMPIRDQLAQGVRGLMLDAHQYNGRVRMCHGPCALDSRPMSDVFTDIADFLKAPGNEKEIVTVFTEDYVDDIADLRDEVGDDLAPGGQLAGMLFNPSDPRWDVANKGWPKVSQLVDAGNRLLLFSDSWNKEDLFPSDTDINVGFAYQHNWTAENYWSLGSGTTDTPDWTCRTRWDDVPLAKEEKHFRRLFVMNHFRDMPFTNRASSDNQQVLERLKKFCQPAARKKPNFLAVDHFHLGGVRATVEALNQYTYHPDTPGYGGTPDSQGENWHVPRLSVMPLGDSITLGVGSSTRSGYRAPLWPMLTGRADTLDFVGSQREGQLPDIDHEGHSGWLIEGIAANVDSWLEAAKPNVVTLHIGTNDMDRDNAVASAPARLAALLDQMIAASPQTTIVVATLVPSTSPAVQARINAYNAQLPGIVKARQDQGHKVVLVSMGALTNADIADRLHPNNTGYAKMAAAFAGGITAAGRDGWISDTVTVRPAPPRAGLGDYQVDVNADGYADYLTVDAGGAVRAWLNKGGTGTAGWTEVGQIASGVPLAGGQVRFADVNGDRYADYLVVDPNGAVRAWLNKGGTGTAGWTDAGQIASGVTLAGGEVRFADINGDKYADYVVVDPNSALRVWLNKGGTGTAGWTGAGQIASGVGVPGDQIRLADVNGDAYADYLAVDAAGAVRAWLNKGGTGTAGWTDSGRIAAGTDAPGSAVRFADIDADRRADYVVVEANGAVRAWLNKGGDGTGVGGGGWTTVGTFATSTGSTPADLRFADINADRRDDYLTVAADGSVQAWLNNGTPGSWTPLGTYATTTGAPGSQVRFADLNADGRADYLTVAADGSVKAWLNQGGVGRGGWTELGTYASGTGSPGDQVRFADLNADGRADYLSVAADGSVKAWLNQGGNGNGGWTALGTYASGTGATGSLVRFADLNADGRADYLALAPDGSAKAWLNRGGNGNGGWTALGAYAPALGAVGTQPVFAEANGDARADYLAVAADGSVQAWTNNGAALSGGWTAAGVIATGVGVPASQVHI
ncbi:MULTISPECIES: FG-GAP-like repeat-containing protein [unclassified Streptomyces]|uniref:FG-GAP-like repeat-containing protein n=1 Tax=unclassified Streptomyces TaxID=2593676 RepID=UPI000700ED21|nr:MULTISPECIES: FG-GAP-like repeat-containing protein [unclassified Streptomyces]KQX52231.1 esterase [Streptomyces sp. Root1304]KRA86649.1 esterase [Streptomyces sp. Root66D1]